MIVVSAVTTKSLTKNKITPRFAIFQTDWGVVGIVGHNNRITSLFLPQANSRTIINKIARLYPGSVNIQNFLPCLQAQIKAYFQGKSFDFTFKPDLQNLSEFTIEVLDTCRSIPPGQTLTYGQLAQKINRPNAARAVGNALAANPLPLIIPCHRVTAAHGKLGGYSGTGGTKIKQSLINHESKTDWSV